MVIERWDADFYVKVDDDVHVNLDTLAATLVRHDPSPESVEYHEPEHWKFGDIGNKVILEDRLKLTWSVHEQKE
ncbi:probable beta-1 3-galactosyltransferase 2 [Phtheirospermum japonicum]|uniref:Probable beta-1 3-galactosyltransferase 2 n=1 Tax=Phtheirospermum japonicum TaxID=374723 RepID=A0A830DR71_9LAMI|nr:probable beta-1 3-galactosyltransferase 2 [Phtheirospermum japonicum]